MGTSYKFERYIEDDFISLIGDNTDLTSYAKRRILDASNNVVLPAVIVGCQGIKPHEAFPAGPCYVADVDIMATTHISADKNGAIADAIIGYIRDTLDSTTIAGSLDAKHVGNIIDYHAVLFGNSSRQNDDQNLNVRTINLIVHFEKS
jgi:hypothetical protein